MMQITNSTPEDIDQLFELYDAATAYQKKVGNNHWKGFDRALVLAETVANRQWKIMIDGEIAGVFLITFNDPLIWLEKDNDQAIYIHRIATNPVYRGHHLVKHIVQWAATYARQLEKQFVRLDTGSGNEKLNSYYISCGFSYLGIVKLRETGNLPAHYKDGSFSLFEIDLQTHDL